MTKRYHPDGHHDPGLSDLREALEAIFVRLGESYEVLRSPRLRARYDRGLAGAEGAAEGPGSREPQGEEIHKAIVLAASFVARERYWEALPLLESAVPRATGEIKQRGRILLARIYARDPDWVKQAEELLLAVIQQQPDTAEAHFYLGVIYRHLGLRSRALASFRKVVELEPDSDDAWQHIAQLDRQARLPVHIKKLARGG
jgi:curved DNA-binding protein CbpA